MSVFCMTVSPIFNTEILVVSQYTFFFLNNEEINKKYISTDDITLYIENPKKAT